MPQPRKPKQPGRKPKAAKDDNAVAGWTVEAKPLEAVRLRRISPTRWGDNLGQLRTDFLSTRKEDGPLRCPLFQNSTSKADPELPPVDILTNQVARGSRRRLRWELCKPRFAEQWQRQQ